MKSWTTKSIDYGLLTTNVRELSVIVDARISFRDQTGKMAVEGKLMVRIIYA
jgi:hypothetical protein